MDNKKEDLAKVTKEITIEKLIDKVMFRIKIFESLDISKQCPDVFNFIGICYDNQKYKTIKFMSDDTIIYMNKKYIIHDSTKNLKIIFIIWNNYYSSMKKLFT